MKKSILIFIILILLILAFFVFWFFVLNNLDNLKNNNSEMAKKLEETEREIQNIKNLENLFDELGEERQKIRTSIILKEDLVKFIEDLESLADKSGAEMRIKSIQLPRGGESFYPALNIESSGDFNDVYYFIEMLESLPYFISFDRLVIQENSLQDIARMKQEGKKESKWTSKIDLSVLSYYENFQ